MLVISGRAEGASPESILTVGRMMARLSTIRRFVVMDSGLAGFARAPE
jgi:hypothetical protein